VKVKLPKERSAYKMQLSSPVLRVGVNVTVYQACGMHSSMERTNCKGCDAAIHC
jgi:hypothetical protein